MKLRSLTLAALTALLTLAACGGGTADTGTATQLQTSAQQALAGGLAGVALAHLTPDTTTQALAGVRQVGSTAKIQAGDAFMIGSTTKAMTAALAARLVEQGVISWTTTLAQALPDLADGMQPAYRTITLEQLLSHRGGLLAFTGAEDTSRFEALLASTSTPLPTTLAGRERFFAAWLLAQDPPPQVTPGQTFAYSNAGYAMAALMLEARSGRAFADLFEQELAKPLGIKVSWTAADATFTNRPLGHQGGKGKLAPVPPEMTDVALWLDVLRPGGEGTTITPGSYATWVRWHLQALRGEKTPLAAGYVLRIKALQRGDYALGWVGGDIDGRRVLFHNGEYAGFSSLVAIDAQGRSASFGLTNTEADDGVWVMGTLNQTLLDIERALPPTQ